MKSKIDGLHLSESYYYDESAINGIVFCRNPTHFPKGPWCFVDKNTLEWEYCNIPSCVRERHWCKTTDEGKEYMGSMNYTENGIACMSWLQKGVYRDELFPEKSRFYAGNKCRNPENMAAPWCFYAYSWQFCDVPDCEKGFSQIEYFGGYDFLKSSQKYTKIIPLNDLYQSMTVTVKVNIILWQWDVRRKTTMWATDYDLKCQTDMNTYEFCQVYRVTRTYYEQILTYWCRKPLRYLIFISSLRLPSFDITYSGRVYNSYRYLTEEFLKYQDKIRKFIATKDRVIKIISLPTGHFYLINDNAMPYAITINKKIMATISTVGKGCVAFLHSQVIQFDENNQPIKNYADLTDLFQQVYKSSNVIPQKLTAEYFKTLQSNWQTKNDVSTPVVWNSIDFIGNYATSVLLNLIKAGLNIIIEIIAWEYPNNFVDSELQVILLASGIWPAFDGLYEGIRVIDEEEIVTFPLVHMIDYAVENISNVLIVADTIKTIISNVPFHELGNLNNKEIIFKKVQLLYNIYIPIYKHLIPCLNKPLSNKDDKAMIGLLNAILLSPFGNEFITPGLSFYPGILQTNDVQLLTAEMKLGLISHDEIYQLGLYVIPGKEVSVKLFDSISKYCIIHINFHLTSVENLDEWQKWPLSSTKFYIYPHVYKTFRFPFGGLLSIECEKNKDHVYIVFKGVIRIPYYDRRNDKDFDSWSKINNIVSPWVILAGDTIVFIVPSHAVRNLADPDKILTSYDSVIKEQFHIRGKLVRYDRRMIFSTDIQIREGYMHSGYPIVAKISDVTDPSKFYIFNEKSIETNDAWAILHEIGHNLQNDLFIFYGNEEVINNIFTLVGIESVTKESSWSESEGWVKHRSALETMINYINDGDFKEWKTNLYLALSVYAQLRNSFGWEFYSQIFRRYDTLTEEGGNNFKLKLWIETSSSISGMNLCPLYELWRWPFDISVCDKVKNLPLYLPNDFLTERIMESRITEIFDKYGGSELVKRTPNKIPVSIGPVKNKLTTEGDKIIEEIYLPKFIPK